MMQNFIQQEQKHLHSLIDQLLTVGKKEQRTIGLFRLSKLTASGSQSSIFTCLYNATAG